MREIERSGFGVEELHRATESALERERGPEFTESLERPRGNESGPTAIPPPARHPVHVYLASLGSDASRATMRQALNQVAMIISGTRMTADELPWWRLRYSHTQALRSHLAELYAPATANKMLSALRGVLRECWRLGYIDAETFHRAIDLKPVRGSQLPAGRALTHAEVLALLEACKRDGAPSGARDAAIIGLAYGCGLRRSELARLEWRDCREDPPVRGQWWLDVRRGKGRKDRRVPLALGADRALWVWVALRGTKDGPLFHPIDKAGRIHERGLTSQAIYQLLLKRARKAGIPPFSPHDLRRAYGTVLLERGADLAVVARLMGHSRTETTRMYDRRDERAMRRASLLIHVPY